ncbi:MAG: RNA polymerase sigma factor [Bacteroidales bacterium]|nr:RNA polymerase sigma factor [Bacteroidales bacterium]
MGPFCIFRAHEQNEDLRDPTERIVADTVELKLIESCIKGDRASQKAIYDRLAPRMLPLCMRYVGDRSLAEDVLQDGFITLFTHMDSYKGNGSFEGWARKIFVTTALMELRKKDALKMSDELDTVRGMKADLPSQGQNIGYKELMKLVLQLPAGFRTVFNMYAVEGYSHKEIGDILGISESTSRTQLSRARICLQNMIKEIENV